MTTAEVLFLALTFVIHGAVVYRVARFIALDSLIQGWRDWVIATLEHQARDIDEHGASGWKIRRGLAWRVRWARLWRMKLMTLIECPWCVTIWVSGATVVVHHFFVDPLPYPVFWWLGAATLSLVYWDRIEPD